VRTALQARQHDPRAQPRHGVVFVQRHHLPRHPGRYPHADPLGARTHRYRADHGLHPVPLGQEKEQFRRVRQRQSRGRGRSRLPARQSGRPPGPRVPGDRRRHPARLSRARALRVLKRHRGFAVHEVAADAARGHQGRDLRLPRSQIRRMDADVPPSLLRYLSRLFAALLDEGIPEAVAAGTLQQEPAPHFRKNPAPPQAVDQADQHPVRHGHPAVRSVPGRPPEHV